MMPGVLLLARKRPKLVKDFMILRGKVLKGVTSIRLYLDLMTLEQKILRVTVIKVGKSFCGLFCAVGGYCVSFIESGSGSEDEEEEESESEETSSDEGDTLQNLQKRFGVASKKKKVREPPSLSHLLPSLILPFFLSN